jgi:hypothetical protein
LFEAKAFTSAIKSLFSRIIPALTRFVYKIALSAAIDRDPIASEVMFRSSSSGGCGAGGGVAAAEAGGWGGDWMGLNRRRLLGRWEAEEHWRDADIQDGMTVVIEAAEACGVAVAVDIVEDDVVGED